MSHVPSTSYLHHYQKALSALPEEMPVFVVEGCGDNPSEVFAVFLDKAAANMWCATQKHGNPLDFAIRTFTVIRTRNSELTYLRPGEPAPTDPIQEAIVRLRSRHPAMLARDVA